MPTWAFKTPAAGTSRCPLRQLHMTEEATKEDIAVLRAKKLYHRLKQLRDALAACKLKMAGMGIKHTPERILTGQQCKDLAKEILTVQAEMASAVKAMRSASSGGSAKTYEMGYKEGLTQAQREAARQIGYIKGLKEGWEKAQRAPGPIGPAGPAGPRGPKGQVGNSGNQADASVVKKVMEEEIANEAGEKAELEGAKKELDGNRTALRRAKGENAELEGSNSSAAAQDVAAADLAAAEAGIAGAKTDAEAAVKDVEEGARKNKADGSAAVVVPKGDLDALEDDLKIDDEEDEEDSDKQDGVGADDDKDAASSAASMERANEFNELDVVPSSDADVCASGEDGATKCIPAGEGVTPGKMFVKAQEAKAKIVNEAKTLKLKLWNDALAEQIKVSLVVCIFFKFITV